MHRAGPVRLPTALLELVALKLDKADTDRVAQALVALAKVYRTDPVQAQPLLMRHGAAAVRAFRRPGFVAAVYGMDPAALLDVCSALHASSPASVADQLPAALAIIDCHWTAQITASEGVDDLGTACFILQQVEELLHMEQLDASRDTLLLACARLAQCIVRTSRSWRETADSRADLPQVQPDPLLDEGSVHMLLATMEVGGSICSVDMSTSLPNSSTPS